MNIELLRKYYAIEHFEKWQYGPEYSKDDCDNLDPYGEPLNPYRDCDCRHCERIPIYTTVELPDDFNFDEMNGSRFRGGQVVKKRLSLKDEMMARCL